MEEGLEEERKRRKRLRKGALERLQKIQEKREKEFEYIHEDERVDVIHGEIWKIRDKLGYDLFNGVLVTNNEIGVIATKGNIKRILRKSFYALKEEFLKEDFIIHVQWDWKDSNGNDRVFSRPEQIYVYNENQTLQENMDDLIIFLTNDTHGWLVEHSGIPPSDQYTEGNLQVIQIYFWSASTKDEAYARSITKTKEQRDKLQSVVSTIRNRKRIVEQSPMYALKRRAKARGIQYKEIDMKKGGFCSKYKGNKEIIKGHVLYTSKSENGECFFKAIAGSTGDNRLLKMKKIIEKANNHLSLNGWKGAFINDGGPVCLQHIEYLTGFAFCNFIVYHFNDKNELIEIINTVNVTGEDDIFSNLNWTNTAKLVLYNTHYYYWKGEKLENIPQCKLCEKCQKPWKIKHKCKDELCLECNQMVCNLDKHHCNISNLSWNANKKREKYGKIQLFANVEFEKLNRSMLNMIFFDFETFPQMNKSLIHRVYACGIYNTNIKLYTSYYGLDSEKGFVDYLEDLELEEGRKYTVIGYNNSRYDNHFIITELIKRYDQIEVIDQGGGRFIWIQYITKKGVEITFLDLFNFITIGSLRKNCEGFGIELKKGNFPHKFLAKFQDIWYRGEIPDKEYWKDKESDGLPEDYDSNQIDWDLQEECLKYLELDVLCTRDLYEKISTVLFDEFKVLMKSKFTLSHYAYDVWSSTVTPNTKKSNIFPFDHQPTINNSYDIFYPNIMEYDYIFRGSYGGRTYPTKKYFESEFAYDILEGNMKYEDLEKDYLILFDVVSLYASVQKDFDFPYGPCEIVSDEELHKLNNDENVIIKYGYYEIEFIPNKALINPVLPKKICKKDNFGHYTTTRLDWDLFPGKGVYTNIDIENALLAKYKIIFISGIYWNKSGPLFREFVTKCYDIKRKGEEINNPALTIIGKQLPNSNYGKQLQKPLLDTLKIVKSYEESKKFLSEHIITQITTLKWIENSEEKYAAILEGVNDQTEMKLNKPCYLGGFILSYSRKRMFHYYDFFDPYRVIGGYASLHKSPFYGDTDSMAIKVNKKLWEKLLESGNYSEKEIGKICNDDKKNHAKIIKAYFLAPKKYCLVMINEKNEIIVKMKCAGIPFDQLYEELYKNALENEVQKPIEFTIFKKTGLHFHKELPPFQVFNLTLERSFLKEVWNERQFIINDDYISSVPMGFAEEENFFKEI